MTRTWELVAVGTAVGCGVVGGVLFAFSTFVMSGLTRLPDKQGLAAMQSINVTAVRPPFMIVFFGTAAACVVLVVRAALTWGERNSPLLLTGSLLYLLGTVVLTAAYHVPRNDRLAKVNPDSAGAGQRWRDYAGAWTLANHVRTLAAVAAMVVLVVAVVRSVAAESESAATAHQESSRASRSV